MISPSDCPALLSLKPLSSVLLCALVIALGGGVLDGCGDEPADAAYRVEQRLAEPTAYSDFRPDRQLSTEVVETWRMVPETLGETWFVHGATVGRPPASGGIALHPKEATCEISLPVRLDAGRTDQLELSGPLLAENVIVSWREENERFGTSCRLSAALDMDRQGTITIPVASHPRWRGRIAEIRIELRPGRPRRLEVAELKAVAYRLTDSDLDRLTSSPWRFDLAAEARPALVALPERPITWRPSLRKGDRIDLACGLQPGVRVPVEFHARLETPDGSVCSEAGRRLDPARGEADRWFDIELSASCGHVKKARLELEVEAVSGYDPSHGLAVWQVPRLSRWSKDHRGLNILLISIDTLRADHVSSYGYDRVTSPNLDRWVAERGVLFDTVVASSPWTLPSHVSMLSGLDALRHGANHEGLVAPVELVSEVLARDGFETFAVTGGAWVHPRYGFSSGFDAYRYWPPGRSSERELEEGIDGLLARLDGLHDTRFFAFFHTYEVHSPYRPRKPWIDRWDPEAAAFEGRIELKEVGTGHVGRKRFHVHSADQPPHPASPREIEMALNRYDSTIAYTDAQLTRILDYLDRNDLADSTAVIVTADHGESFGDHEGLDGHAYLYDFNVLVPLLVVAPGVADPGTRVTQQVRLIDLAPTILELAGSEVPGGMDGVSLVPQLEGREIGAVGDAWSYAAKTNRGIALRTQDGMKYIYNNTAWDPAQGTEELYETAHDPEEKRNLATISERADELRDLAWTQLERRERGLLMEFRNPTGEPLRGTVRIPRWEPLFVQRVKGADLPPEAFSITSARSFEFDIPAGAEAAVVLESVPADSLRIVGDRECVLASGLELTLDLSTAESVPMVAPIDGVWRVVPDAPAESPWIRARWRNIGPSMSGVEQHTDAGLRDQLRALGYVQ